MKSELFDYQGTLLLSETEYVRSKNGLARTWVRCKYLASDEMFNERWILKSFTKTQFFLKESLKPVSRQALPLYMDRKYKSQKFLEMFR
jgi:hypothetical protein